MKKIGIMNSEISTIISKLGHTDRIVICDAGLPIPDGVKRIDVALKAGLPSFLDVLQVILEEMQVERIHYANEMIEVSPALYEKMKQELPHVEENIISHEEFKKRTNEAKAIIRTGECTPYANVILEAGVTF
ncbi:D-ribose pyranase [Brevibacillus laterosporus]|uniref:D-ribose pyranase n=1 Tax=Brevibacillus laterosporus LMG 15441 TaxID=1042163 RepID=A0A075R8Z0_BRELA|nr:D-ribose pyranase [Brevibacillus laterosporus]AIG28314.1 D-ribose pyranase [Brevibacillus laterosporus LMG 15441]RJL13400.1 D-ribose pyranase [Brevibacillus laterosporus]TPH16785.1 D-ribose pyranase [Brevibacillus laterosporus]HAS01018.1 D-ribose pyranase [Brevibacillus sp.]